MFSLCFKCYMLSSFSIRNFANCRFWSHFAGEGFSISFVLIVSQTTVSSCYESERKQLRLNDNNKKLRLGLARQHVNAQRKLWKVTEVVHPSIENFRNQKLP